VLSRSQAYFGGKLLISHETLEDTERFGIQGRDSDSLYQLLQAVERVQAVALIRQETPATCTVGLRSREGVDVSVIAARFGGGGHRQAAGLNAPGSIDTIRAGLLAAFAEVLDPLVL
jgi:phosphoesterase RecJ-like protein